MAKKFNYPLPGTSAAVANAVAFPCFVAVSMGDRSARIEFNIYATEADAAKSMAWMYGLRPDAATPIGKKEYTLTTQELLTAFASRVKVSDGVGLTRVEDQAAMCYEIAAARLEGTPPAEGDPDTRVSYFEGAEDLVLDYAAYAV